MADSIFGEATAGKSLQAAKEALRREGVYAEDSVPIMGSHNTVSIGGGWCDILRRVVRL